MTVSPPALNSLIDIYAFYSRYVTVTGRTTNSARDGKEWHGSCPRCHGSTDRFSFWESGRFSCSLRSSGCGWHGSSPYWFLRDEGYTHHQACDELGIDPYDYDPHASEKNVLPLFMTRDSEPVAKWMDAAEAFVWRAQRYLWTLGGAKAFEYLQSRGLREETIRKARIGYCPGWFSESLEAWGLLPIQTDGQQEIKIPAGIVIPWFVDGKIWKIQVKRFEDPEMGYFQALGSSDCLYGIDDLQPGQPVLLIEGEFDKLSVEQEAGDLITAIATGGASKGQSAKWISKLKTASQVLIGFDLDENKAGDEGAVFWQRKLPNATRWTPWAHDVNQMLTTGISVRAWVELGLKSVQTTIAPAPIPEPVQSSPALLHPPVERSAGARQPEYHDWKLCKTCGKAAIAWKNSEGYCRACCPWKDELRPAKPAIPCASCAGKVICVGRNKQHIRARWIWFETDHTWICNNCYTPAR